jgi:hypothetical protein
VVERPQQGQDLFEVGAPEALAVAGLEDLADRRLLVRGQLGEGAAGERGVEHLLGRGAAARPPGLEEAALVVERVDRDAQGALLLKEMAHDIGMGVARIDPQAPAWQLLRHPSPGGQSVVDVRAPVFTDGEHPQRRQLAQEVEIRRGRGGSGIDLVEDLLAADGLGAVPLVGEAAVPDFLRERVHGRMLPPRPVPGASQLFQVLGRGIAPRQRIQ